MDCSNETTSTPTKLLHSKAMNKLKSMDGINSKVIEDWIVIIEKFPCNELVSRFLVKFVRKIDLPRILFLKQDKFKKNHLSFNFLLS